MYGNGLHGWRHIRSYEERSVCLWVYVCVHACVRLHMLSTSHMCVEDEWKGNQCMQRDPRPDMNGTTMSMYVYIEHVCLSIYIHSFAALPCPSIHTGVPQFPKRQVRFKEPIANFPLVTLGGAQHVQAIQLPHDKQLVQLLRRYHDITVQREHRIVGAEEACAWYNIERCEQDHVCICRLRLYLSI